MNFKELKEKFSQRILMTLLIYVKQIKTKTFSLIRVTRVTEQRIMMKPLKDLLKW